jgi:hypothetical protein
MSSFHVLERLLCHPPFCTLVMVGTLDKRSCPHAQSSAHTIHFLFLKLMNCLSKSTGNHAMRVMVPSLHGIPTLPTLPALNFASDDQYLHRFTYSRSLCSIPHGTILHSPCSIFQRRFMFRRPKTQKFC